MTWRAPLQTQPFWNQDAIKQIENRLHDQREQRRGNRAFQNRDVIVQVEPAQNRFTQAARADKGRESGRADVDHGAGLDSGKIERDAIGR